MKLKLFLFVVIVAVCSYLLIPSSLALIGYDYHDNNQTLHFYNINDDYYINLSSGIQLTNHYGVYWSKNIWCPAISGVGTYFSSCVDSLPLNMVISTDNSSYINITGTLNYATVISLVRYNLRFKLIYSLYENDTDLTIKSVVNNLGVNNFPRNLSFIWKITEVKISNDTANDFLVINNTYYNNKSVASFTSLPIQEIYYGDNETSESLRLGWDNKLFLMAINKMNSSLTVYQSGLSGSSSWIETFHWIDAICSWSVDLTAPFSDPNITVDQSFILSATHSFSGTCPATGYSDLEYYNGSIWGVMGTITALRNVGSPYAWFKRDPVVSESVTGIINGTYKARVFTYYNGVTQPSLEPTITVRNKPLSSVCSNYTTINISTTLSANSFLCYNITANHTVFNCNNYSIIGSQYLNDSLIVSRNTNNVTIKDCKLENNSNAILFNNTANMTLTNIFFGNTRWLIDANNNLPEYVRLFSSNNVTINKINFSNINILNATGDCIVGGYSKAFNVLSSTNIFINNVTINNVSHIIIQDSDPEISGCQLVENEKHSFGKFSYNTNVFINTININTSYSDFDLVSNTNFSINNIIIKHNSLSNIFDDTGSNNLIINNSNLVNANLESLFTNTINLNIDNFFVNNSVITTGLIKMVGGDNHSYNNISIINSNVIFIIQDITGLNFSNSLLQNVLIPAPDSNMGILQVVSGVSNYLRNVRFINNNVTGTTNGVVFVGASSFIYLINVSFINNTDNVLYNYYSTNLTVLNSSFNNSPNNEITNKLGTNTLIVDTIFNKSKVVLTTGGEAYKVLVGYTVRVNLTDQDKIGLSSNINITDRYGAFYGLTSTLNGMSPYIIVPEYRQNKTDNYSVGCTNSVGIGCYSPYNFTVITFPHSINKTQAYINISNQTVYLTTSICKPPLTGDWLLGEVCWIEYIGYNQKGKNLVILRNASLYLDTANLTIANLTKVGNLTIYPNSSLIKGVNN